MRGELLIGLRDLIVRVPRKPAQTLAGWKLRFKRQVREPVEVEPFRPAFRVIPEDPDIGMTKVHSSLDRLGRAESQVTCPQPLGVQGVASGVYEPRMFEVEVAPDLGPDQPDAA